jgi:hypothetical protein
MDEEPATPGANRTGSVTGIRRRSVFRALGGSIALAGCLGDDTEGDRTGTPTPGSSPGTPSGTTGAGRYSLTVQRDTVDLQREDLRIANPGVTLWKCAVHSGVLYTGTRTGIPAKGAAFDLEEKSVVGNYEFDTGDHVLSIAATDEFVYFVTSKAGGVYRLEKASDTVEQVGSIGDGSAFLNGMDVAPDGTVYVGSNDNSRVYEVDPEKASVTTIGPLADTEHYAYDLIATGESVFVGVGNTENAGAYEIDRATRSVRGIRPDRIGEFVTKVMDTGRYLLFHLLGDTTAIVDRESKSDGEFQDVDLVEALPGTFAVGDRSETAVYYPGFPGTAEQWNEELDSSVHDPDRAGLYRFDVESGDRTLVTEIPNFNAEGGLNYRSTQVADGTFVGVQDPGEGTVVTVDLEDGQANAYEMEARGMDPTAIAPMDVGAYDGNAVTSQNGAIVIHGDDDPERVGIDGEIKRMVSVGDRLYMGQYPDARLLVYDGTTVEELGTARTQSRPLAMHYDSTTDAILMGTQPGYGMETGGALTRYDVESDAMTTHENAISDQSINAVTTVGEAVYVGGVNRRGQGTSPATESARLAKIDPETGEQGWTVVPSENAYKIVDLIAAERFIVGMADAVLFAVDRTDGTVLDRVELGYEQRFERGPDDRYYGVPDHPDHGGLTRTTLADGTMEHSNDEGDVANAREFAIVGNDAYFVDPDTWRLQRVADFDSV